MAFQIYDVILILSIWFYSNSFISCDTYFAPSLFLNHGGGPWPLLDDPRNREIANFLKNVSRIVNLKRLKAIILVTAHREEEIVTISSGMHHDLLYDYSGFPPESYKFKYGARGDPKLARKIYKAFKEVGMPAQLDERRGWDHGVFVPMMLINPKADIPIIQVSVLKNQNAREHLNIGKVLHRFRKEGVAIFGSGMSYHNMKEFFNNFDRPILNNNFDKFLNYVCTGDSKNREYVLDWTDIPEGLESHPPGEAEHLMPLIVNIGAAGLSPGRKVFESVFMKKFKLSGFIWDQGDQCLCECNIIL